MIQTEQVFAQELYSPGYLLVDVPQDVREDISKHINRIIEDTDCTRNLREYLRGHVENQFELPVEDSLETFALDMAANYFAKFGEHPDSANRKDSQLPVYELNNAWVNFQKKGDFNPLHHHTGSYSFVIWVRVPYKIEDEQARYSDVNGNEAASFNFYYTDAYGGIASVNLPVDETFEWKCAFFPSRLNHSVNPFSTSDEYRISVSGNVFAK